MNLHIGVVIQSVIIFIGLCITREHSVDVDDTIAQKASCCCCCSLFHYSVPELLIQCPGSCT